MNFINCHDAIKNILEKHQELDLVEIHISSRGLKNEEAIGNPDRKDFPLLRGKEVLLQADINGFKGQAFTGDPIMYSGKIKDILELPKDRVGNNALQVATLNALLSSLGEINNTIHCINNEPEECAKIMVEEVVKNHGLCRIGIIGYQPAILEECVRVVGENKVMITDLNPDTVGTKKHGVKVLDGLSETKKLIDESDVLLITGTILANGTEQGILDCIKNNPFYFFGTTCAGIAKINKFNRICPMSK
jgi:hypothetical protein